jgi:hypothetical protein
MTITEHPFDGIQTDDHGTAIRVFMVRGCWTKRTALSMVIRMPLYLDRRAGTPLSTIPHPWCDTLHVVKLIAERTGLRSFTVTAQYDKG